MLHHTQGRIHLSEKADIKSTHVFLSTLVCYIVIQIMKQERSVYYGMYMYVTFLLNEISFYFCEAHQNLSL